MDDGINWGKLIGIVLLFILGTTVLGIVCTYLGVGVSWATVPATIVSPNNVQKEFDWFYNQQQALRSLKSNIAVTQNNVDVFTKSHGEDQSRWTAGELSQYTQLVSIANNYKVAYNDTCGTYQARWDNVFHNVVAPRNIPRDCEMIE